MASSKRNEIRTAIQQRVKRFSAFELLGLEADQSPTPSVEQVPLSPSIEIPAETSKAPDTTHGSDISDGLRMYVCMYVCMYVIKYIHTCRSFCVCAPLIGKSENRH
jgi:hypothetical protein